MKKVMLFLATMLLSVSAFSASLTLTDAGTNGVFGEAISNFGMVSTVTASQSNNGLNNQDVDYLDRSYKLVSDVDTSTKLTLTLNDTANVTWSYFVAGTLMNEASSVTGQITLWLAMTAGTVYDVFFLTDFDTNTSNNTGTLRAVSNVPVPAALFLFAPALLGFLGLRRKATLAA